MESVLTWTTTPMEVKAPEQYWKACHSCMLLDTHCQESCATHTHTHGVLTINNTSKLTSVALRSQHMGLYLTLHCWQRIGCVNAGVEFVHAKKTQTIM